MITSIGRDGVLASISIARQRSTILFNAPSRSFSKSYIYASSSSSILRHPNSAVLRRLDGRWSSTIPPPITKPTTSTDPPLPVVPHAKKPKVNLQPGPLRPKSIPTAESSSGLFPKSSVTEQESSKTASTSSGASAPSHESGIIQAAKDDLEAASQHGILAPPPENANKLRKLFHQAKELFKFYWGGLKLINTNRKRAAMMRARVKSGGLPLSRWETRFIQTYDRDALKLIPFALIILIAEELIPLVVMYAPFILPSTCILPAQKERIDRKKRAKQQAHVENMKNVYNDVYERALANPAADIKSILDAQGQLALCGLLGHSRFGLPALRLMRIRQDLTFVAKDDALLLREERGARLTDAELREALEERGILTDDLTPKQWQSRLEWWLTNVDMAGSNADPVNQRILLLARSATGRF